jgi:hypothetical protein
MSIRFRPVICKSFCSSPSPAYLTWINQHPWQVKVTWMFLWLDQAMQLHGRAMRKGEVLHGEVRADGATLWWRGSDLINIALPAELLGEIAAAGSRQQAARSASPGERWRPVQASAKGASRVRERFTAWFSDLRCNWQMESTINFGSGREGRKNNCGPSDVGS